jgi:hypothetical protein
MSTSPSLSLKQTTAIAQVRTERETKDHILPAEPGGAAASPGSSLLAAVLALTDEAMVVRADLSGSQLLAEHLLLPGLQVFPQGVGREG